MNLEVGDILEISNCFGTTKYKITRVTKNKALSLINGYEHSFQREISSDMAYPRESFNVNDYTVIKARQ